VPRHYERGSGEIVVGQLLPELGVEIRDRALGLRGKRLNHDLGCLRLVSDIFVRWN